MRISRIKMYLKSTQTLTSHHFRRYQTTLISSNYFIIFISFVVMVIRIKGGMFFFLDKFVVYLLLVLPTFCGSPLTICLFHCNLALHSYKYFFASIAVVRRRLSMRKFRQKKKIFLHVGKSFVESSNRIKM